MDLSNAKKGMGLLYTAVILELISTVLGCLILIFGFTSFTALALSAVGTIAIFVLAIISLIWYIRGVNWAMKDEPYFKNAMYMIICMFVAEILDMILPKIIAGYSGSIVDGISALVDVLMSIIIIQGIQKIYEKLGNDEMVKKGKTTAIIYCVSFIIAKVLEIVCQIKMSELALGATLLIGALVCLVLSLVAYIRMLGYLNHARKDF